MFPLGLCPLRVRCTEKTSIIRILIRFAQRIVDQERIIITKIVQLTTPACHDHGIAGQGRIERTKTPAFTVREADKTISTIMQSVDLPRADAAGQQ